MIGKEFDHSHYEQWIDPHEVKPYERNAKKHDDIQIANIANSIHRFGWQQDTVLTKDNILVIGHGRRLAAIKLGCEMPYHVVDKTADELTDEDIRELRIADNQTNAETGMDWETLEAEIADLDFDGFDFDLFAINDGSDFFQNRDRNNTEREEGNEEYNEFLEKFEPKKTTDDCYTPDVVYDAVANWVATEYKKDKRIFVRPFFPGGDYKKWKYKKTDIVVDNPPFSILSEILKFYAENNVYYFLFAPTLTLFSSSVALATSLCVGVAVTYENGASVNTSFLTNLEPGTRFRSAPTLYSAVDEANKANLKELRRELPKYKYPSYVVTSTMCSQFSRYGIDFRVSVPESHHIRQLDSQKGTGDAIYGSGFLISETKKQEKEKAEKAKVKKEKVEQYEQWELSDREKDIVRSLG